MSINAHCSMCGEPAERRFTEVVAGRRQSTFLCLGCAGKQDLAGPVPPVSPTAKIQFQLQAQLLGHVGQGLPASTLRCPVCGMRVVDLRKSGRLGCANCYEVFRKQILPLLKRIHGATEHAGLRPARAANPQLLREELRRAIAAEDFEEAARLRDRIGSDPTENASGSGEDHE